MSYIIGAFGVNCSSKYINKLSSVAELSSLQGTIQKNGFENGIIFSGQYKCKETQRNNISPLIDNSGIIIGKIFDKEASKKAEFNIEQVKRITVNPERITKEYWGRYIAALYNKENKTLTLIRDPLGLLTLFYIKIDDGILFSTEAKLLYDALEKKPELDMNFFAEHMININQALPTTPFQGIKELLPGMSLTIKLDGSTSYKFLWDIESIKSSAIKDKIAFEQELLSTLKTCVKAWTEDAKGVCVELSGGTDSSGVMLLLHEVLPQDKKLICVNYIDSKTASSNEIEYAKEIAEICDSKLEFIDWQTSTLLDPLPNDWFPNKPGSLMMFYNTRRQIQEFAKANNCDEIMNGQGGDHVFLAPQPKRSIADYWLDNGFSGIGKPFNEIVGVYRAPWFSITKETFNCISNYYRKIHKDPIEPKTDFFNKEFLNDLKKHKFYLIDKLVNFYPAKASQIESLCHAVSYAERDIYPSTVTHPLLSQPIVEIGLNIPTYQSFDNGFDRIFFRNAVTRIKKTNALWRKIKGQTTGSMVKACSQQYAQIRDIIMSGQIANSGMINKQWFDIELTKMKHGHAENLWPIIHILTSQLWINKWNL